MLIGIGSLFDTTCQKCKGGGLLACFNILGRRGDLVNIPTTTATGIAHFRMFAVCVLVIVVVRRGRFEVLDSVGQDEGIPDFIVTWIRCGGGVAVSLGFHGKFGTIQLE